MWKYWPIFIIEIWFFDTHNTSLISFQTIYALLLWISKFTMWFCIYCEFIYHLNKLKENWSYSWLLLVTLSIGRKLIADIVSYRYFIIFFERSRKYFVWVTWMKSTYHSKMFETGHSQSIWPSGHLSQINICKESARCCLPLFLRFTSCITLSRYIFVSS